MIAGLIWPLFPWIHHHPCAVHCPSLIRPHCSSNSSATVGLWRSFHSIHLISHWFQIFNFGLNATCSSTSRKDFAERTWSEAANQLIQDHQQQTMVTQFRNSIANECTKLNHRNDFKINGPDSFVQITSSRFETWLHAQSSIVLDQVDLNIHFDRNCFSSSSWNWLRKRRRICFERQCVNPTGQSSGGASKCV